MKPKILAYFLILAVIALSACAQATLAETEVNSTREVIQTQAEVNPEPEAIQEVEGTCVRNSDQTRLLINSVHGYCLRYPAEYDLAFPNANQVMFFKNSILNTTEPIFHIDVQPSGGMTVEQAADEIVAVYAIPGMEPTRMEISMGGEKAIRLDGLSGQDPNRQVVVLHGDTLYTLFFIEMDKNQPELVAQAEALFETVIQSFNFRPETNVCPDCLPPAVSPTDTPDAAQSSQEYTNQDFGFSLYYPNGYELQSTFYHTITFLAPQGTQGHRERAFMQVELAGDQTAEWYASRVKEENANLGTTITSSTMDIGGQPAQILGSLPGQDLNRQVFIVYKGILYHLTFMPDDPQAGEDYQQMENLYTAIVTSLRFLPDRRDVPPVTDVNNLIYQLEKALEARSADDILRTLGDEFFVGGWLPQTPEGVTYVRLGRNEAAPLMIDKYVSQAPNLVFQKQVDWQSLIGSPEPFSTYFPDETVRLVLVHGWGSQGSDEAVIIIARRIDGSLYWRGVLTAAGGFGQ